MIPERFKHLFNLVGSLIAKQDTNQQTRSLTESCKMLLMQLENIQFRMFFRMFYNYLILFH